jgi:hypothetical protein
LPAEFEPFPGKILRSAQDDTLEAVS